MKISARQIFWMIGLLKECNVVDVLDDMTDQYTYANRKKMFTDIMNQQPQNIVDIDDRSEESLIKL